MVQFIKIVKNKIHVKLNDMHNSKNIHIKKINLLFKNIFSNSQDHFLFNNLDTMGILNPIEIIFYGDQYYLLDGFSRLAWAQSQALDFISCNIYSCSNFSDIFKFMHAFKQNFTKHPAIQARVIQLMEEQFPQLSSDITLLKNLSTSHELTHFSDNTYRYNIKKLSQLNPKILEFCWTKKFSFTHLKKIILFKHSTLNRLISLNHQLQWTAANFIKAASYVDHLPELNLIEELNLVSNSLDLSMNHSKQLQTAFLNRLRFLHRPTLHTLQKKINDSINSLDLPENMSIKWDKSLEIREIILSISIKKKNTLKKSLELFDENRLSHFEHLLDML